MHKQLTHLITIILPRVWQQMTAFLIPATHHFRDKGENETHVRCAFRYVTIYILPVATQRQILPG